MREAGATLASGTRLGRYEIVSFIAAGGMGEVYQANDSRLNRRVAIKVLPAAHGTSRERLARFEKEARSASRLAHPNIISVYDFGEQDELPYIVTELLEGRTLAGMLGERQMAIETVMDIAVQVARGLAAAHDKRIVHRDLKPANIFITTGGDTKILDFGLAKLTQDEWQPASTDETITRPGEVVGSSAYMSPEQVQGAPVDIRSDIFSFGSVLYEMLSGRRPFAGRNAVETLSAILRDDPPPISRPDCGADLVSIVNRCLQKRPDARFGSASELLFALKQIAIGGATNRPERVWVGNRLPRPVRSLTIVVFVTLLVSGPEPKRFESGDGPAVRIVRSERLTTSGTVMSANLSPDGAYLAYSNVMRDHEVARLRHLGSGSDIELVPFRENRRVSPAGFSPDGNHIYLRQWALAGMAHRASPLWEPLPLVRIPLLGGTPETLPSADWASRLQFAPDGKLVAFIRRENEGSWSRVVVADPSLQNERIVAELREGSNFIGAPAWSSDSQRLMVAIADSRPEATDLAMEIDVVTGAVRRMSLCSEIEGPVSFLSAPDDGWIAGGGGFTGILWHVSSDGSRCRRITDGAMQWSIAGATSDRLGVVAIGTQSLSSLWRESLSPGQAPTRILHGINTQDGLRNGLAVFADGRIVFTRNTSGKIGGNTDIWVLDQGENLLQVTDSEAVESHLAASPDGRTIVFVSTEMDERKNPHKSLRVRDIETGETRALADAAKNPQNPSFSPDGQWVYFFDRTTFGEPAWVQRVPVMGGAVENVAVPVTCDYVRVSPDGRFLSCLETGVLSILSMLDGQVLQSVKMPRRGMYMRWLPDSSAVAYAHFIGQEFNIIAVSTAGGEPRRIAQLSGEGIEGYAFTPDGSVLCNRSVQVTDAFLLHLESETPRTKARLR
jgi:serine/threonine protein kinase